MIYTSYFAVVNRHPLVTSGSLRPLSIARRAPAGWPVGESASYLWPEYRMLMDYKEGILCPEEYERLYRAETLSRLVPEEVVLSLESCVMVCYEKPGDFCHRHIVSRWLKETTGTVVNELVYHRGITSANIGTRREHG